MTLDTTTNDNTVTKHISHIIAVLCRASKVFTRWIYTVPKFIAIYLKVIRQNMASDHELTLRLLKTLQHIVTIDRKSCLIIRLEGGIKILMSSIGNGGGSHSASNTTMRNADGSINSGSGSGGASGTITSTAYQKLLRALVELLLVVIKANEHNSTALVTQSIPHLNNLLHVCRNQQGHIKIFQTTLQILEKLCKEKKIVAALLGPPPSTPQTNENTADSTHNPNTSSATSTNTTSSSSPSSTPPPLPPLSPAVQSLLSALGPGVNSFMTWCMYTLLNSKLESVKHSLE